MHIESLLKLASVFIQDAWCSIFFLKLLIQYGKGMTKGCKILELESFGCSLRII